MKTSARSSQAAELLVVVPALNEEARLPTCLGSLVAQAARLDVRVSDNGSTDATADIAASFGSRLSVRTRTVSRQSATAHFVSAGRWGLETSNAPFVALLAGDDAWAAGFAEAALSLLTQRPDVDVACPSFRWVGGDRERDLPPVAFASSSHRLNQARALVMSDRRELANLVYGVYRRTAFEDLLNAWERGGEQFGSDYAAAWCVLGRQRVVACPQALGLRYERSGVDLISRVGAERPTRGGVLSLARTYVVLNLRVNTQLRRALIAVAAGRVPMTVRLLPLLRAPQWVWGAVAHLRASGSGGADENSVTELGDQPPA